MSPVLARAFRPGCLSGLFVAFCSGCYPGIAWLPDSSGFVYTSCQDDRYALEHYDLATGENRILVERRPAGSLWLAIRPECKVQTSRMGSNQFRTDIPNYLEFYRQGRLDLDSMISRRGRLSDINEAFRAMKAGEVARTVLMFD